MCEAQGNKRSFPLDVVRTADGYAIVIQPEGAYASYLLKPGWGGSPPYLYTFETEREAWDFLKQIFTFCLKQRTMNALGRERVINCEACRRVFRAKTVPYCDLCLRSNEELLRQIWQGFYFQTGCEVSTYQKMLLLLQMIAYEFEGVPDVIATIVENHVNFSEQWEKQKLLSAGKPNLPAPRMHYRRA